MNTTGNTVKQLPLINRRFPPARNNQPFRLPLPDRCIVDGAPLVGACQMEDVLDYSFYCRARQRTLPLRTCLADYVTHTAFAVSQSPCTQCEQGAFNRNAIAQS